MKSRKRIKILVITPYFYPKIGGLEKHTYNLYKSLKQKYHYKIIIVTSNHENDEYKEEILNGMKIYRLSKQFKISNTPISFRWKKQIKEIIKKEKPDIINAHSPVPFISDIVILSNKDIPKILKYHSGSMKKEIRSFYNIIISIYERFILGYVINRIDYLICTSDFVRDKFLKKFKSVSITIPPAVDLNLFKTNGKLIKNKILYVGRLDKTSRWKGLDYLLEATKIVRRKNSKILLNIVGEGDDLQFYLSKANELGISKNVNFLGKKTGMELSNQYSKTNILILPSISEAEAFGMVLIEAMACKKPVIGSNIGGIPYVIDDGKNGILVPPKDPKALADAIIKLLKNPKLAKQMGENGYKKVKENFSLNKQIIETNKVILNVLNQNANYNS